ncbi:MAG: hypothetical protein DYH20_01065 [Gammaproteobacteria bacterium PRO9]|nr:hypothetical protein [Gammaproteobacteria bacterium PRO9]
MGKLTFIANPERQGAKFSVYRPDGKFLFSADSISGCEDGLGWYLKFFPVDGTYRIEAAGGGELEAMGFGVATTPSPTLPGQLWLPAQAIQVGLTGAFSFTVTRGGGSAGAVAVDYSITLPNGTPTPASGTVSFAAGETGAKTVNVTVAGITAAGTGQVALSNPRSTSGGSTPVLGTSHTNVVLSAPPSFAWDNVVPAQALTVGQRYTRNLNDYVTPDAARIDIVSGSLPAGTGHLAGGAAFDPVSGLIDLTPSSVQAAAAVTFRATDVLQPAVGADAEYALEAGKPGVFYKQNFDYATRAELMASAGSVRYGYVGAPSGESNVDPAPAAEKVGLDPAVKLTGRASLLLRFRAGLENLTQAGPSYNGSFNGVGSKTEGPPKSVVYMRYVLRFNANWLATSYSGTVTKHMIIFGLNTGFSAGQHGLDTHCADPRFPHAWQVRSAFLDYKNVWNRTPPGAGDHTFQPFVDLGPQGVGGVNDSNNLAWFQRRYGPVRREAGRWSAIADIANYPVMFRPDTFYVILHKIDKVNDEVKVWMAEYGHPPVLFTGAMNAGLTETYSGFQCLFRPTDGTNLPFSGGDLCQWVDQIIASDNMIAFPGGYQPPYSAPGAMPPGYPFLGSSEDNGA